MSRNIQSSLWKQLQIMTSHVGNYNKALSRASHISKIVKRNAQMEGDIS